MEIHVFNTKLVLVLKMQAKYNKYVIIMHRVWIHDVI